MQLKLLDLNMWMLPAPIASDQNKRLQRFILLAKRTDPDIITLQEVWLRKYITFIRKNLPGYHLYRHGKGMFNRSGLVTLTKKIPQSWTFHMFPKLKGQNRIEKLAGKGYLMIRLNFASRQFHIVNTHLYCQEMGNRKKITEQQFEMLKHLTARGNWIISGDLNIDEPEFRLLNKGHFTHHTVKVFTVSAQNKYSKSRMNRFGKRDRKLDYTLLKAEARTIQMRTEVLQKPLISDHYAVLTIFNQE